MSKYPWEMEIKMETDQFWDMNFEIEEIDFNGSICPLFVMWLRIKPDLRSEYIDFRFTGMYGYLKKDPMEFVKYVNGHLKNHQRIGTGLGSSHIQKILSQIGHFLKSGRWYEEEQMVMVAKPEDLPLLLADMHTTVGMDRLTERLRRAT